MGQCYDVRLELIGVNQKKVIEKLNHLVAVLSENMCTFSLDRFASEGVTTNTFEGILRIFVAGWKSCPFNIEGDPDKVIITNGFEASYGWDLVLDEMFRALKDCCDDGSTMYVSGDNYTKKYEITNGEVSMVFKEV